MKSLFSNLKLSSSAKKYISAVLYALEMPLGVLSGLWIDHGNYFGAAVCIIITMALIFVGVVFFAEAMNGE